MGGGDGVSIKTVCYEIYFNNDETNKITFFPFPHLSYLTSLKKWRVWIAIYCELEVIALDSENQRLIEL